MIRRDLGGFILKNIYQQQWQLFKQSYWKTFVSLFLLFIIAAFVSYNYMLNNQALMNEFMLQIMQMFEETELLKPGTSSPELALGLFINNTRASLLIALTGFIPIFLPALSILFFNGAIMGVLFAFMSTHGVEVSIFSMLMTGIVPHGVFEIPAVVLSGAIAFYLSLGIFRKLNDRQYSFKTCVLNAGKTFLFVVVPLLIIAAIVEAFITPLIMTSTVI
jgi:stage II sporulation protein M